MRALTLDFRRGRRAAWLGFALLATGVAGAAVLANEYRRVGEETTRVEARIREHGAAIRKKPLASGVAADRQKIALEVRHAHRVIRELGMPWNSLFTSVEEADAPAVALLSVESDVEKQNVKINAEAKNLGAMLEYLRDLEGRAALAEVFLQSHQIQQQDPQRPVRFVITATWRMTSPGGAS